MSERRDLTRANDERCAIEERWLHAAQRPPRCPRCAGAGECYAAYNVLDPSLHFLCARCGAHYRLYLRTGQVSIMVEGTR